MHICIKLPQECEQIKMLPRLIAPLKINNMSCTQEAQPTKMGNIRQEETIPKLISHGDKPTKVQMGHGLIAISIKKGNKS